MKRSWLVILVNVNDPCIISEVFSQCFKFSSISHTICALINMPISGLSEWYAIEAFSFEIVAHGWMIDTKRS